MDIVEIFKSRALATNEAGLIIGAALVAMFAAAGWFSATARNEKRR